MAANNSVQDHRKMYHKVLGMLKYGGIAVLIVAFIVIWLISSK